ncbi:hypothetical protein AJ79_08817 [Helicocarpus griseus UAMH5409]|uniref:Uncharacterized protein n=1 Tax=Helicocarpus griseus UAMH5409 TaxID=1447875 RepID=A0A2B7WPJ8_9EURO|nr:hypothetical protein AJ79_08817 [Helicocarpus griseus UAMH5409]
MAKQAGQAGNNAAATYLDIPAIGLELRSMKPSSAENHSYGLWDAILNVTFPVTQRFITRPQAQHSGYGGKKGFFGFSHVCLRRQW